MADWDQKPRDCSKSIIMWSKKNAFDGGGSEIEMRWFGAIGVVAMHTTNNNWQWCDVVSHDRDVPSSRKKRSSQGWDC